MEVWTLLAINAVILAACFVILWAICLKTRDVTPVDSFWAFGMVVMAISSFALSSGEPQRKGLLLSLCALWGLRLGGYMIWRWRSHGTDRRYAALLGKAEAQRGWSFAKASALLVFATQAPLLFIVCLPVQLGQLAASPPLGALAAIGAALSLFGVAFEAVGDLQLVRFKADPVNAGRVMDRGLWRFHTPSELFRRRLRLVGDVPGRRRDARRTVVAAGSAAAHLDADEMVGRADRRRADATDQARLCGLCRPHVGLRPMAAATRVRSRLEPGGMAHRPNARNFAPAALSMYSSSRVIRPSAIRTTTQASIDHGVPSGSVADRMCCWTKPSGNVSRLCTV